MNIWLTSQIVKWTAEFGCEPFSASLSPLAFTYYWSCVGKYVILNPQDLTVNLFTAKNPDGVLYTYYRNGNIKTVLSKSKTVWRTKYYDTDGKSITKKEFENGKQR